MFGTTLTLAQTSPDPTDVPSTQTPPAQTVSVTPQESLDGTLDDKVTDDPAEQPDETFLLPVDQHPWAKFKPGAWRELQIVTTTYGKAGRIVSSSTTTQKEILETVAEDKYLLNIQATIDMVGKRIVGNWKKRILNVATDHVGQIVNSKRSAFVHPEGSPLADSQVWEVSYSDGAHNRFDRISYDPQRYPFILQRESFLDQTPADTSTVAERVAKVIAQSVSYQFDKRLLECSFVLTNHRRAKGDTQRLAFVSGEIPGGEIVSWSTDFDAEGNKVRGSTTKVMAFGLTAAEPSPEP